MDYSERRMRAELSSFPDGVYSFEDVVENDGIEREPYTVAVDLHVQGDEVVADFRRTSKQAKGPINATLGCHDRRRPTTGSAPDRRVDPEKFRLLPADPGRRAARHG